MLVTKVQSKVMIRGRTVSKAVSQEVVTSGCQVLGVANQAVKWVCSKGMKAVTYKVKPDRFVIFL